MSAFLKSKFIHALHRFTRVTNFRYFLNGVCLLIALLFSKEDLFAQNVDWQFYQEFGLPVHSIAIEDSLLWMNAGWNFLIKLNLNTGDTTFYSVEGEWIDDIEIDSSGNKWLGTMRKIIKFDNHSFEYFNLPDYGINGYGTHALVFDSQGNLWFGFDSIGFGYYDGTSWHYYYDYDVPLTISDIAVDRKNVKWLGTPHGLVRFYDDSLTYYSLTNSDFPAYTVNSIAVDSNNHKWIGTYSGLIVYDDSSWTVYNKDNSPLPNNNVYTVYIDQNGTIWLGLDSGYLVEIKNGQWTVYDPLSNGEAPKIIRIDYQGNIWGVTAKGTLFSNADIAVKIKKQNLIFPSQVVLYPNIPNPFNSSTTINFYLPKNSPINLSVFDLSGRKIKTLINGYLKAGKHSVQWNGLDEQNNVTASGVYFFVLKAGKITKARKMFLLK
ncbi:ligand-binding sensor domain-containing protein [Calditrichota bacterium LG25]